MKTDQIRTKYLDFFKSKAHTLVASDSLVPQNDPTLLFTGAGMNQFKEYFLGLKKDLKRATSSQKCLRTGDLEEVGRTAFHHSFFEMLGNFSFGDYFKKEAIEWGWEFLTKELKIDPKRLRVSVHKTDDEAYEIWSKIVRKDWIYKLGDKDNFWPANAPKDGPNGPCGPCSEIYFDQDPSQGEGSTVEDKRFAEIWNLVFTQYDRQDGGKLVPLAQKNIDTGMGLERLACVLQGKKSNYEIDTLNTICEEVEKLLKVSKISDALKNSVNAITDHVRAVVFCIADGAIPSNEGRGYVVRKLIRRALWHAHKVIAPKQLDGPFLYKVVPVVVKVMKPAYPELVSAEASITEMLRAEEERFLETLENGINILNERLKDLKGKVLPGEVVFLLYDTYGFPEELTRYIAGDRGLQIDHEGFEKKMEEQRKRAKDASQIAGAIFVSTDIEKKVLGLPAAKFLGYSALEGEGKVLLAEIKDGKGVLVLDQTPCYGESGGQVGDQGTIENGSFQARLLDTQKKDNQFLHAVEIVKGNVKAGDSVKVKVDVNRRARIMRNHTATHLLHAALREILGNQVRQLGSLVHPDRLRFDFSYGQALTPEQIKKIEDRVNEQILNDTAVTKEEKAIEDAKNEGAIAFFGEKYGAQVRIVTVPGFSKEFCGGTHCDRTGQIGLFVIVSESSIASGTRRIEALTGEGAIDYVRSLRSQMGQLAQSLKTTPDKVGERVLKLQDSYKKLEKDKNTARVIKADAVKILEQAKAVNGLKFAAYTEAGMEVEALRHLSDDLRSKSSKTVYFIGTESEEKINFLLGLSPDLAKTEIDIRDLAKELSSQLGTSGGGRKDLVQAGGKNTGQFQKKDYEEAIVKWLKEKAKV